MKKRSRWILPLAVLLCLSTLFVSCRSNAMVDGNPLDSTVPPLDIKQDEQPSLPSEPPEIPQPSLPSEPQNPDDQTPSEPQKDNSVLFYDTEAAQTWGTYLTYRQDESQRKMNATQVMQMKSSDTIALKNGFHLVTRDEEDGSKTYTLYNLFKGIQIGPAFSTRSGNPGITVQYNFSTLSQVLMLVTKVETGSGGSYRISYLVYDNNGTCLTETPLTQQPPVTRESSSNVEYTYILGRVYIHQGTEILRICAPGEEHDIPYEFAPDVERYGNYLYVMDYSSATVYIFDTAGTEIMRQTVPTVSASVSSRAFILSNGNLLLTTFKMCDLTDPDYNVEGEVYNLKCSYTLLDLSTKQAIDIPVTFLLQDMITPATEAEYCSNIGLLGDYQLACLYPITDKKPAHLPSFVILNNDMTVKAVLPNVFKNQAFVNGMQKMQNGSIGLVITTENAGAGSSYYTLNLADGAVRPAVDTDSSYIRMIGDGFLWYQDDVLYANGTLERLYDLSTADEWTTCGNSIVARIDRSLEREEAFRDEPEWEWVLMTVEDGALRIKTLSTEENLDYDVFLNDGYNGIVVSHHDNPANPSQVTSQSVYDQYGNLLFEGKTYEEPYAYSLTHTAIICVESVDGETLTYYLVQPQ